MSFGERLETMRIYHNLLMLDAYAYRLHRGKAKMPGKWNSNKTESLGSFYLILSDLILNRSVKS